MRWALPLAPPFYGVEVEGAGAWGSDLPWSQAWDNLGSVCPRVLALSCLTVLFL